MTVNGTTTTVNSTVTTIADPIITLGANGSDDNKDRGFEFKYNDGSAKIGFMGYDDSRLHLAVVSTATGTWTMRWTARSWESFGLLQKRAHW